MFKIGDKVVLYTAPSGYVYEITYITKDGYYVCESDNSDSHLYGERVLKLWEPVSFSYFHPVYGLHNWLVVRMDIKGTVVIQSTTNTEIKTYVPVELVKHYLGDKYV